MLGVLTYNIPHRKTYDTLCLLKAKSYKNVKVFTKPLHYKKRFKPILEHRPQMSYDIYPEQICRSFGFEYYYQKDIKHLLEFNSKILVCGSGIIEEEVIEKYRIINSHPGYIPNVRGLDALKWAIYEREPIGVTTHQIGPYIDAGLIIERKLVPIFTNDTFHSLAQRQYDLEIYMLVDAIERIENAKEIILPKKYKLHKRMPFKLEQNLLSIFEELKFNISKAGV